MNCSVAIVLPCTVYPLCYVSLNRVPIRTDEYLSSSSQHLGLCLCHHPVHVAGPALAGCLWRLQGGRCSRSSIHPILATSPADFWRRYNRYAGQFFYENVYWFWRRRPFVDIVLSFFINGVFHEYLVVLLTGRISYFMTLFFVVQGMTIAVTAKFKPTSRAAKIIGILAQLLFIYFSPMLFFGPVNDRILLYSHP